MTNVLCHTPILLLEPKNFRGVLGVKIIYSLAKYSIKHPVVYFLSNMSTLKISSEIYVIRHIITKIIGIQFYCGTNFLNTLYNAEWEIHG